MRIKPIALTTTCALLAASAAAASAPRAMQGHIPQPASAAKLVEAVDLPHDGFTLANGLRVVVRTDRKAPVVAVSVWYDVGSKHEPAGSTGFAHLFEHLMFHGSENMPGPTVTELMRMGATGFNGATSYDQTLYFETVPTPALARALYLESDRMGYLTGAISQAALDEQRGVVQNEKREGDNEPYGLMDYAIDAGVFPAGHPYGHSVIGSMADLDSASLGQVKGWFKAHYGPNNAVLVLTGDIDAQTARPLVERYFGRIPAGAKSVRPSAPVPVLAKPVSETIEDRVPAVMLSRTWPIPGNDDLADALALSVASDALGDMDTSRLATELLRKEKLVTEISASALPLQQSGTFTIRALVRPGVDPALVNRRIDQVVADYLQRGPTREEVELSVVASATSQIESMESVKGQAAVLANGTLHAGNADFYKKRLAILAALTPDTVRAAARKWLGRPAYSLTIVPGPRDAYREAASAGAGPRAAAAPDTAARTPRAPPPPVGEVVALPFPTVERARLSNGIEIVYARRTTVPMTRVSLDFDAGTAADVADKLGTQGMTLAVMTEGTRTLDSDALAATRARLGATIRGGASPDVTGLTMNVPSANIAPALTLLRDIAREPAFSDAQIARIRDERLALIAQELSSPDGLARRLSSGFADADSPYAKQRGTGDAKAVAALTRADLIAFQQAWLRPEKAKIFVVSDRPLAEVRDLMEQRFGDWRGVGPEGVKMFGKAPRPAAPQIFLVDRPDAPQSLIRGVLPTALRDGADMVPLDIADRALGEGPANRINASLREGKHWTYGAGGGFIQNAHAVSFVVSTSVQQDKTGPALAELRTLIGDFVGAHPMTREELADATDASIRSLPGRYEGGEAVLSAMESNDLLGRPADYFTAIAQRYRVLTLAEVRQSVTAAIDPAKMVWLVIGDAAKVKPQLEALGLPVRMLPASGATAP